MSTFWDVLNLLAITLSCVGGWILRGYWDGR